MRRPLLCLTPSGILGQYSIYFVVFKYLLTSLRSLSVPVPSTPNCKLDKCLEMFTVKDVLDGNEMPYCDVSYILFMTLGTKLSIETFFLSTVL